MDPNLTISLSERGVEGADQLEYLKVGSLAGDDDELIRSFIGDDQTKPLAGRR